MNGFIRITNDVIEEKFKGKIHISSVRYYTRYGVMVIELQYRKVDNYEEMGLSYKYCKDRPQEDWVIKADFENFIDGLNI